MASLGLGWIGEPALASVIEPAFSVLGDRVAVATAHTIAVAIAFAIITALHIVLGELAPKTIALQHPERDRARRGAADRAVHAGVLAVHPPAERHGPRRRARVRHCAGRAATRWCTPKKS